VPNILHDITCNDKGDDAMAQAAAIQLEIGKGSSLTVATLPCLCPVCSSTDIKHNGHDTSVKGSPQYLKCNACGMTFYVHTSYYVEHFGEDSKIKRSSKSIGNGNMCNCKKRGYKKEFTSK